MKMRQNAPGSLSPAIAGRVLRKRTWDAPKCFPLQVRGRVVGSPPEFSTGKIAHGVKVGSSGLENKHRSGEKPPRRNSEEHLFTQSKIGRGVKVGSSGLANKQRSGDKSPRQSSEEHLFTQSKIARGVKLRI